jgi:hypothetical protein
MAANNLSDDILGALACLNLKSLRAYIDANEPNIIHIPQHNISVSTKDKSILFKRGAADLYSSGKLSTFKLIKLDPKIVTYLKLYKIVVGYESMVVNSLNNTIDKNMVQPTQPTQQIDNIDTGYETDIDIES